MDVRNIKKSTIKKFTLKATASAILSINANLAMAVSCPAIISDSTLASVVCTFDATTGSSVTVENGGTVAGIHLTYDPASPSYLLVESGGLVQNTSASYAIELQGDLSNGFTNNGTISITRGGNTSLGVRASGTISGGVTNNGSITARATGNNLSAALYFIGGANGGIVNTGTLTGNVSGSGLHILSNAINGGVNNSGTIQATGTGTALLVQSSGSIADGLTNSGIIQNTGSGNAILISSVGAITGGLNNTGLISAESAPAIYVNFSSSSITGGITNSGTITSTSDMGLQLQTTASVTGGITNSGLISGGTTGLAVMGSSTSVSGGIFNSGTIQGTTAIFVDNFDSADGINITGNSARIIGNVTAQGEAFNILSGAVFTSEGTYDVDTFNIASGAAFNMANSITAASGVTNAGTLEIADPLQTITGTYTQSTGGTFQTDVASTSDYGQLLATGAVDLSQSGNIYVNLNSGFVLQSGSVLSDVINSSASLTTPTNGFNVTDNSFIWKFTASLNNATTGVNLTASIDPNSYNACQGTYCQGAANVIIAQNAAGNSSFSSYGTLSTASAFKRAASQATPELVNENIQTLILITRSVLDIVPMWTNLRGRPAGDALLYPPGKIWVKPYGASLTQKERSTVPGFNATAYGAVIGKDIQLSKDWLFGAAFAAGGDNMRGKAELNGQTINSSAYQLMTYASKRFNNNSYFAGQALLGYEKNDASRTITLYNSTAQGSFNSWFTNIRAEAGWSTYLLNPNFVFTPEIDASYLYISQGGYRESGSPMNLSISINDNSSLILGTYGNFAYYIPKVKDKYDLTLTGYAGFAGDIINSQPQLLSTFVAGGAPFSTFGVQFNEVVFRGGAGLKLTSPDKPLVLEINYDAQVGNNAYSNIGAATIKYRK